MQGPGSELSSSPPGFPMETPPHRHRRFPIQTDYGAMMPGQEVPALGHGSSSPIFDSPSTVRHPGRVIFRDELGSSPIGPTNLMLPSSPPENYLNGSPRPRFNKPMMPPSTIQPITQESSSSVDDAISPRSTTFANVNSLKATPRRKSKTSKGTTSKVTKSSRQPKIKESPKQTLPEFYQVQFPVPAQSPAHHLTPPAGPLVFVEQFAHGRYQSQTTSPHPQIQAPHYSPLNSTSSSGYQTPGRPRSAPSSSHAPIRRPSSADFKRACSWRPHISNTGHRNSLFGGTSLKFVVDDVTGRAAVTPFRSGVRPLDARSREVILAEDSDSENEASGSGSSSGNSVCMSSSSVDGSPTRTVGRKAICDAAVAFARILTRSRLGMARTKGNRVADTPNRNITGPSNFFYHPPSTPARTGYHYPPVTPRAPVQLLGLRQLSTQTPPGAVLGYDSMGMFATGLTPYLPHSVT